ncbi:hypothetical protein Ddc_14003 [Ditylenchus destructor]|nr:hypothetical protein Ddc_14003 [Ditylenchus destructor]
MQYLTYLVFGESILTLIIQIFAVTVLSNLALRAIFFQKNFRNGKGIPRTLLVYLLTELVFTALSVPYYVYVIFWWRPVSNYDVRILYWLGMYSTFYLTLVPVPLFFVTLDRCIALKRPLQYNSWTHNWLSKASALSVLCVAIASTCAVLLELPLEIDSLNNCQQFACIVVKSRNFFKFFRVVIEAMNLILGIYFLLSLRSLSSNRVKNLIVRNTVIFDVCLNILPNYFDLFYSMITGNSSAVYLGQYVMLLGVLDAALCGTYYTVVFLRKQHKQTHISVPSTCT